MNEDIKMAVGVTNKVIGTVAGVQTAVPIAGSAFTTLVSTPGVLAAASGGPVVIAAGIVAGGAYVGYKLGAGIIGLFQ